jgi:hypothetical protein
VSWVRGGDFFVLVRVLPSSAVSVSCDCCFFVPEPVPVVCITCCFFVPEPVPVVCITCCFFVPEPVPAVCTTTMLVESRMISCEN